MKKFILALMLVMLICSPAMAERNIVDVGITGGYHYVVDLDSFSQNGDGDSFSCTYVMVPVTDKTMSKLAKITNNKGKMLIATLHFSYNLNDFQICDEIIVDNNGKEIYKSNNKFKMSNFKPIKEGSTTEIIQNIILDYVQQHIDNEDKKILSNLRG